MRQPILQWNVNGFYPQKENLSLLIKFLDPCVVCLQETNFKAGYCSPIKNFKALFKNRLDTSHASGGVVIYVKNEIYGREIQLNTGFEATAAIVQLPFGPVTICNVYLPNTCHFSLVQLQNLIEQLPKPFLILGDFNSHSLCWGSYKLDERGRIVEQLLETPNIICLNKKQHTHFNNSYRTFSAIDLALCCSSIGHRFDWTALSELYGSDHFPIVIHMNDQNGDELAPRPKWIFAKANWSKYQEIVSTKMDSLTDKNLMYKTSNDAVNEFTHIILEAADNSIPRTRGSTNKRQVPWWDAECRKALQASKQAFNKYKRHATYDNIIEYKKCRSHARRTFKYKKQLSWKNYVSSMNGSTSISEAWKKINKIRGTTYRATISSVVSENQIVTDSKSIAETLARCFATNSSDSNYDPSFLPVKNDPDLSLEKIMEGNTQNNPALNCSLQLRELKNSLSDKMSSPGPDNIFNIFLEKLPDTALQHLLKIYNKILFTNTFPDQWREAIVIPIPKPNRDQNKPENYRPIALTSNLCKLMETIINKRILWYLEQIHFLSPHQSGFRKHRSTLDNLITIESDICNAFISKEHLVAIALDIEKAYDMVWRERIVKVLLEIGLNGHLLHFISNFLQKRTFQVRVNGILSRKFKITNGVPQGAVLSVTLFLVAINEITQIVTSPIKKCLYADDLIITCRGLYLDSTKRILQELLDQLNLWTLRNGFKISKTKTEFLIFSRTRNTTSSINLNLGGDTIKEVEELRILGVTFDRKLTWTPHIRRLKAECLQRTNITKSIASCHWGADKSLILSTYKALIRTKLDYASIVYDSATSRVKQSLNAVHSMNLRLALGAFKTSPVNSILAESNEIPLSARRQYLSLKFAAKMATTPDNPVHDLVFCNRNNSQFVDKPRCCKPLCHRIKIYLDELNLSIPRFFQIRNYEPYWLTDTPNIDMNLSRYSKQDTSPTVYRTLFNELIQNYENHIKIYTDGSRSHTGCGCAIILPNEEKLIGLDKTSSIFFCEAYAIYSALKFIESESGPKFAIFTDSKSVLENLHHHSKEPIVQEILNLLLRHSKLNKYTSLVWIPSHVGIVGNEKADSAAKLATTIPPETHRQSHNVYIARIYHNIVGNWNTDWLNSPTKLHTFRKSIYERTHVHTLSKREQVILVRLRIGHTRLTHGHLFAKTNPARCDRCDAVLTIKHILVECQFLNVLRQQCNMHQDTFSLLNEENKINNTLKFINLLNIQDEL